MYLKTCENGSGQGINRPSHIKNTIPLMDWINKLFTEFIKIDKTCAEVGIVQCMP